MFVTVTKLHLNVSVIDLHEKSKLNGKMSKGEKRLELSIIQLMTDYRAFFLTPTSLKNPVTKNEPTESEMSNP